MEGQKKNPNNICWKRVLDCVQWNGTKLSWWGRCTCRRGHQTRGETSHPPRSSLVVGIQELKLEQTENGKRWSERSGGSPACIFNSPKPLPIYQGKWVALMGQDDVQCLAEAICLHMLPLMSAAVSIMGRHNEARLVEERGAWNSSQGQSEKFDGWMDGWMANGGGGIPPRLCCFVCRGRLTTFLFK